MLGLPVTCLTRLLVIGSSCSVGDFPSCCAEQPLLALGEESVIHITRHAVLAAVTCACLVIEQCHAGKVYAFIVHVALCMPAWPGCAACSLPHNLPGAAVGLVCACLHR
jgi:hypothetical protein